MHRKISVLESVFNKVAGVQLYEKETPAEGFFCEYCKSLRTTCPTIHALQLKQKSTAAGSNRILRNFIKL